MRWYKIEYYNSYATIVKNRVYYIERQYTTLNRAVAAADKMFKKLEKQYPDIWCYLVNPI